MRRILLLLPLLGILTSAAIPVRAQEETDTRAPVRVVAERQFTLGTPAGDAVLRYDGNGSLDAPDPAITRALIVIHGINRNADDYARTGEAAAARVKATGTLVIAPQFLTTADVAYHALPPDTLGWRGERWVDGDDPANAPLSAFAALDTILARLTDRARFPALRAITIAGHSAGGQFVQRYAVVGNGPDAVPDAVALRFVVANPSSYLYFDADRPTGDGDFAAATDTDCPDVNRWKYGWEGAPPYVTGDPGALETRYSRRDVVYLLGTADTNPDHPLLDKSCAAEAQGPQRFARGQAYFQYVQRRHPDGIAQHLITVPNAGHNATRMFTAPNGLAALFP